MSEQKKRASTLIGRIVGGKKDKTITVRVDRRVRHAVYGKTQTRKTVLQVHDDKNDGMPGDVVQIESCRPISKTKSWRLVQVIERAQQITK